MRNAVRRHAVHARGAQGAGAAQSTFLQPLFLFIPPRTQPPCPPQALDLGMRAIAVRWGESRCLKTSKFEPQTPKLVLSTANP
jgi:hypothetical protein